MGEVDDVSGHRGLCAGCRRHTRKPVQIARASPYQRKATESRLSQPNLNRMGETAPLAIVAVTGPWTAASSYISYM